MSSLVTIRRCATLPEALICDAMLRDRGIFSSISNYAHASVNWFVIPALNGVGVSVPACDYKEARAAIVDAASHGPQIIDEMFGPYEPPDEYGRPAVWFLWLNFFGIFWLIYEAIVAVLDLAIPDAWKPPIPRLEDVSPVCLHGYCSYFEGWSYKTEVVQVPPTHFYPPFVYFIDAVPYYLFIVGVGVLLSRSARRFHQRRNNSDRLNLPTTPGLER